MLLLLLVSGIYYHRSGSAEEPRKNGIVGIVEQNEILVRNILLNLHFYVIFLPLAVRFCVVMVPSAFSTLFKMFNPLTQET